MAAALGRGSHAAARLFEDIAWSTPTAMAQSRERAAEISLPVVLLPTLYDVDDAETLGVLEAEPAGTRPAFAAPGLIGAEPRHTRAMLAAGSRGRAA